MMMYESHCVGCLFSGWTFMNSDYEIAKSEAIRHLDKGCTYITVYADHTPYKRLSKQVGGGLLELDLIGGKR